MKLFKVRKKHDAVCCRVYRTDSNICYGLKVKNHTLTDVCIIISTLTINLINSIEALTNETVSITDMDEKKGIISFYIPSIRNGKINSDTNLLFESYLLAVNSLKANYPKYINLIDSGRCNYDKP